MPSRKRKPEGNCMWCDRRTTRSSVDRNQVMEFICVECGYEGHCFSEKGKEAPHA